MNRDWTDFKSLHSNLAGAREAFEDACETLYRKIHPDKHVSKVQVKVGDGGIDIFIGELGIEPITVIQCKFFLETFGDSQKAQIRSSFESAATSEHYQLKNWILCIPRLIDIDENSWWFKWKKKTIDKHSKQADFIRIVNGNELIALLKDHNLYDTIFEIKNNLLLQGINDKVDTIVQAIAPIAPPNSESDPKLVLFNNYHSRCEPFYHIRTQDTNFISSLELNNVWVYGRSGMGKTALINRNLIQNNIEYCFCDCSPIHVTHADHVMDEIIYNVEEKFGLSRNGNEPNRIKQLKQLLCQANRRRIAIVIDELSVENIDLLRNIATDLVNLVVYHSNSSQDSQLRFVISTIKKPLEVLQNMEKTSDHFMYIDCSFVNDELRQLCIKLSTLLDQNLKPFQEQIAKGSENSPRVLKNIFRKLLLITARSEAAIAEIIANVKTETTR